MRLIQRFPLRAAGVLAVAALLAGGCASKGMAPVSQLATSRVAVTEAEAAGAREYAALDLLSARDKLNKAEAASREEKYEQARRLAEEAEVDARLAESKARTAKSQRAAAEVQDSINALRRELERKAQ